jgi:uncharacterized protein (TIGR00266 family)
LPVEAIMQHEILYQPSYSLARVMLMGGESIVAESGGMVSMSQSVSIDTKMQGGVLGALKRTVLGGESFFLNVFTASAEGELTLAPPLPSDIRHVTLQDQTLLVQSGSYMTSAPTVDRDISWAGAKGFFAKEGLFLLKLSGSGDLFLSSYGAIHEVILQPGQRYIVDNGHIVAFDAAIQYRVITVGSIKSTLFSGEGLVCEFTGPGRLLLQTRSFDSFLAVLIPLLPKPQAASGPRGSGLPGGFGRRWGL